MNTNCKTNVKDIAILKLFKGYLVDTEFSSAAVDADSLALGLLVPETAPKAVIKAAAGLYGKDGMLWNQTLHKSWETVANTPMAVLLIQQLMHYVTTYGFENLGCYSDSTVYIPTEALQVPELDKTTMKFTAIMPMTEAEVSERLLKMLTSGIALSAETIDCVKVLSDLIDKDCFDNISNREVKIYLYDKYNIVPKDPDSFLRFLVYKCTNNTLFIQNVATYKALRRADKSMVLKLFNAYGNYAKLSAIFLRNKNIFLALKTKTESKALTAAEREVNSIVNKLRKLAVANHKPMRTDSLLNTITSVTDFDEAELIADLKKITLFRAIRILNALSYRLIAGDQADIVYRVRNGKSYVSKCTVANTEVLQRAYKVVKQFVVDSLAEKVAGKTVCIPDNVIYKAPTSEKQFVNNVPEGSFIELPVGSDLIFATHWYDLDAAGNGDYSRVDLDMRMMNNAQNFGWNASWRDEGTKILFSGDVTAAPKPKGATEAIFVRRDLVNNSFIVTLNDFTGHVSTEVPFEFVIATANSQQQKYVIDPNKIIAKFNLRFAETETQRTLGMVQATNGKKRYYFNDYSIGGQHAVSSWDKYTSGAFNYMQVYNETQTTVNDLLKAAGANIVSQPTIATRVVYKQEGCPDQVIMENLPVDIDLSVESLTKDTFINLFN